MPFIIANLDFYFIKDGSIISKLSIMTKLYPRNYVNISYVLKSKCLNDTAYHVQSILCMHNHNIGQNCVEDFKSISNF